MLSDVKGIWLKVKFKYSDFFFAEEKKSNLLIGNRRKNGNQHRINIPTTIPNVLAKN